MERIKELEEKLSLSNNKSFSSFLEKLEWLELLYEIKSTNHFLGINFNTISDLSINNLKNLKRDISYSREMRENILKLLESDDLSSIPDDFSYYTGKNFTPFLVNILKKNCPEKELLFNGKYSDLPWEEYVYDNYLEREILEYCDDSISIFDLLNTINRKEIVSDFVKESRKQKILLCWKLIDFFNDDLSLGLIDLDSKYIDDRFKKYFTLAITEKEPNYRIDINLSMNEEGDDLLLPMIFEIIINYRYYDDYPNAKNFFLRKKK